MTPYWHVQRILLAEFTPSIARSVAPGLGFGLSMPLRLVRDRIRFEDEARQPYVPPSPDTHHRNETLRGVGDPVVSALLSRPAGAWIAIANLGTSIPLGRTEENPFELGRLGLPHQHIQFGTGTWDPRVTIAATRPFGRATIAASASARLTLGTNGNGYRAGNRRGAAIDGTYALASAWTGRGGLALEHEDAETWDGRNEDEGNLGRTDLFLALGISRRLASGSWGMDVRLPLASRSAGEQVEYPVVLSLRWSR